MLTVWAHQHNKPEFSNSPSVVLCFPSTGFCNISGDSSETPTTPAPWAARLVALPGWSEGTPKRTRRQATWRCSGFPFGLVFWLPRWPSPGWTHWKDGPTHQEWPQDKVRPWCWSPGRNLPRLAEKETDDLPGLPGREHLRETWGLGRSEALWYPLKDCECMIADWTEWEKCFFLETTKSICFAYAIKNN